MNLTPEQQAAVDTITHWVRHETSQILTLGGYAGTGKTTLVKYLLENFLAGVLAPTGKAVYVLGKKGVEAKTVHSFLYFPPIENKKTGELEWTARGIKGNDFLIVDESSMIAGPEYQKLLDTGFRILFVGDHGQLPPVGVDPGIMWDPKIRLERILRQAAESPILRFAHSVRAGDPMEQVQSELLTVGHPGFSHDPAYLEKFDQVLCGTNNTRILINMLVRSYRGFRAPLCEGDKVICLKNDFKRRLVNGLIATVTSKPTAIDGVIWADMVTDTGDEFWSIPMNAGQFHQKKLQNDRIGLCLFDFGYAITVHKSQGSEWPSVLVIEEPAGDLWDPRRWRYTAATRASERLVFLSPFVSAAHAAA